MRRFSVLLYLSLLSQILVAQLSDNLQVITEPDARQHLLQHNEPVYLATMLRQHATLLDEMGKPAEAEKLRAEATAQQPAASTPGSNEIKLPPGTLPVDPEKFTATIRDSYYHPDELSGLDCKVSIDWVALFGALKTNVPEDRMKIIQGLTIRVQSARGKQPNIAFDWAGQSLDTKEQVEDGFRQMIDGFYQMYWSMIASFPIKSANEIKKVEPLPDGGATVYLPSQNVSLILTVDKEHLPTHYAIDSPAMKGTIDSHYSPSPNPITGDLRRLTGLNVVEQIGN